MEAEEKAIAAKKSKLALVFEKEVLVDYDQPLLPTVLPNNVKDISDDVLKTRIEEKRTGKWLVNLGLVFAGSKIDHSLAKTLIKGESFNLAGVYETMALLPALSELPTDKFRFTALKDEMIDRGVEFVFTVYGTKKSACAVMDYRDYLPDKDRWIVVELSKPKQIV